MVDVTFTDKSSVVRIDGGERAVFVLIFDFRHFVCVNPAVSVDYAFFFVLFEIYFVCHINFLSFTITNTQNNCK